MEAGRNLADHPAHRLTTSLHRSAQQAGRTALDAVSGPFEEKKPIYDALEASLGKFGLHLDEQHLKATRPVIAEMLGQAAPQE